MGCRIHVDDRAAIFIHRPEILAYWPRECMECRPKSGHDTTRHYPRRWTVRCNGRHLLPAAYFALRLALGEFAAKFLFDSQNAAVATKAWQRIFNSAIGNSARRSKPLFPTQESK